MHPVDKGFPHQLFILGHEPRIGIVGKGGKAEVLDEGGRATIVLAEVGGTMQPLLTEVHENGGLLPILSFLK